TSTDPDSVPEDGRPKTVDRRRSTEDGRQKTVDRRRSTEDCRQKGVDSRRTTDAFGGEHPQRRARLRLTKGLLALAFLGLTTPLHAEGYLSPFAGAAFSGSTNGTQLTYGGSFTIAAHDSILGVAIDFSRTPDFFGDTAVGDNSVTTLMGNLVIITP